MGEKLHLGRPDFNFRQFTIHQRRSAWPVNTDSVLLGAWVGLNGITNVLDAGTGTGVLSLMIADRCENCQITGIEVDPESVEEAMENINRSPWQQRVDVVEADITEFAQRHESEFDLVISNPPYFRDGRSDIEKPRRLARHGSGFNLGTIPGLGAKLINKTGKLALVLPHRDYMAFNRLLEDNRLYATRAMIVSHARNDPPSLVLLECSRTQETIDIQELVLFANGRPTVEYAVLVANFYLPRFFNGPGSGV